MLQQCKDLRFIFYGHPVKTTNHIHVEVKRTEKLKLDPFSSGPGGVNQTDPLGQFTHPNSLWSLLRLKVTLSCCGWQIPGSRKLLKSRISRTGEGENSWGIQWHILLLHHSPPWRKCMSAQDMLPRKDGPPDQVVTLTPMMARNERRNK